MRPWLVRMPKQSYKHPRSYTTETFKARLKELYGDRFGLDKVEYNGTYEPIVLVCPVHGEFTIRACRVARGDAVCKKCANEAKRMSSRIPLEEIAAKISNICPQYEVDTTQPYVNTKSKIEVVCPEHGSFKMTPNSLFNGQRCPKCSKEEAKKKLSNSLEWLKGKCFEVHGNIYDLSKFNYVNNRTKGIVTCHRHGDFLISPTKLIDSMQGCPKCRASKLETKLENALKERMVDYVRQYKPKWLGLQSLDFYLPKLNVAIECQGIQHYKPTRFGGITLEEANAKFVYVKQLDERKRKLCEENGVELLYFMFSQTVEDFFLKNAKELETI